jgi:hypothetical protein
MDHTEPTKRKHPRSVNLTELHLRLTIIRVEHMFGAIGRIFRRRQQRNPSNENSAQVIAWFQHKYQELQRELLSERQQWAEETAHEE